jgi:hypothetical protein
MSDRQLVAIETPYRGHRFRSRAEARWAVFFDHMEWTWEYEKEGYDLDGLRYLPDFWLPDISCWFEVKGTDPSRTEMIALSRLVYKSKRKAILAIGAPQEDEHQLIHFTVSLAERWYSEFSDETATAYVGLNHVSGSPAKFTLGQSTKRKLCIFPHGFEHAGIQIGNDVETGLLTEAYTAATRARFEHGESG